MGLLTTPSRPKVMHTFCLAEARGGVRWGGPGQTGGRPTWASWREDTTADKLSWAAMNAGTLSTKTEHHCDCSYGTLMSWCSLQADPERSEAHCCWTEPLLYLGHLATATTRSKYRAFLTRMARWCLRSSSCTRHISVWYWQHTWFFCSKSTMVQVNLVARQLGFQSEAWIIGMAFKKGTVVFGIHDWGRTASVVGNKPWAGLMANFLNALTNSLKTGF